MKHLRIDSLTIARRVPDQQLFGGIFDSREAQPDNAADSEEVDAQMRMQAFDYRVHLAKLTLQTA